MRETRKKNKKKFKKGVDKSERGEYNKSIDSKEDRNKQHCSLKIKYGRLWELGTPKHTPMGHSGNTNKHIAWVN